MLKIITLVAAVGFSTGSIASEGNTLLDDVNIATSTSGYVSGGTYSYHEGTSILMDAERIAMIETTSSPSAIGSNLDLIFREGSALGSIFHDE